MRHYQAFAIGLLLGLSLPLVPGDFFLHCSLHQAENRAGTPRVVLSLPRRQAMGVPANPDTRALAAPALTGACKRSMIAVSENNPTMSLLRREEERCP
jgi:hypothetical protein